LSIALSAVQSKVDLEMDIRNLLYAFYDVEMPIETPTSPGDTAPEPYSVMDLPRMMRPTAL